MERARLTGRGAGVLKYDILTALSLWGMRGTSTDQTTALRLIVLITSRYNWARDEAAIGHRDLSRLWGVTDRTVKREIRRMVDAELIQLLRPGVRGRVATYRIVPEGIARISAPYWQSAGPDFAERYTEYNTEAIRAEGPQVLRVDFHRLRGVEPHAGPDPWSRVQERLRGSAPEAFAVWFAGLRLSDVTEDEVEVTAPSAFVRGYVETHFGQMLGAAISDVFGPSRRLVLAVSAP